ncbi:uncharacterized protein Dwil_GK15534 [Drosophila willistoni]|uniref:Uncharacterized protein n=1 Tax=Drosophila willistoni TaxID=7260 RepID=B4MWU0_DROWI|nr:uncharacterized protein LOC6642467 [Drosophila willistoni]EDW76579.1 uncharacterized protein Dwil_GK15534 [Drosophila willistoni]
MVYSERTDKCSASPKDAPKIDSTPTHKPSHSSGAWSSKASSDEKWKYNNMVKDNRDKFNGMHFS